MPDHINDTTSLENATAFRIHRMARMLRVHLNKTFQRIGLDIGAEQWFILFRLYERSGLSQSDLADKALNDHPNITRMIDGLEKRNLVKRDPDPEDRRRHLISLTDDGQKLMTEMMPVIVNVRKEVFAGVSQDEVDSLLSVLERVEQNLVQVL